MDDSRETTSKRRRKTADKAATGLAVDPVLPDRGLRAILGRVALPEVEGGAGTNGDEISAAATLPKSTEEPSLRQRRRQAAKRTAKSKTPESMPSGAGSASVDVGDLDSGDVEPGGKTETPSSDATPQRERTRGRSSKNKRPTSRKPPDQTVETIRAQARPGSADTVIDVLAPPGIEDEIPTPSSGLTVNAPSTEARPDAEEQSPVAETAESGQESGSEAEPPRDEGEVAGRGSKAPPSAPPAEREAIDAHLPSRHHWVYAALVLFLAALGFGLWGLWSTVISPDDDPNKVAELRRRNERLSQDVSTLRRSDQISREANRDLQRTLAERDEEIAGLRADVAFYERFVGATGQRRGLSVHDLEMRLQNGDVWHFVATLTQNLNRGAVNTGRLTLSVEGTRNDRLERLSWSSLRKQNNAPGLGYSFKYFQQVEGEVMLPAGFKPLRVTVRLVPAGGSAAEQSFPWPETLR